jgi:K+-transporting ATPase A subunit
MSPWLSVTVVITVSVTVPMVVAKRPEWLHKNEPVKNIRQAVQDVLIMPHDNNGLDTDNNKK